MCLSLREIEALVDALPAADRARLLEYLKPRVEDSLKPSSGNGVEWQRFREVGDRLATGSVPGAPSVTNAVTEDRR